MSCAAVLPCMAAEEKSLLQQEQELLEQKFEEMNFTQLMSECREVWIGEVLLVEDNETEVKRPKPQMEVIEHEDGTSDMEWVDRSTEQWIREERTVKIHKLDTINGYTFEKLPEHYESAYFVKRFVSQNDGTVLEAPFMDVPALNCGEKLLIFGAPTLWLRREQYIMDSNGNMVCCYKTGESDSNGGMSIDDF
ncbi:MAG: hypothetical protein PUB32_07715 [Clostridiales bacterium]|nr:hypothetical protein [Clostridiales bacterium]